MNEYEDDEAFAKFINYMKKALLHRKLNYLRKKKRILKSECPLRELNKSSPVLIEINTDRLDVLSDKERLVLKLHIVKKMTYEEIGKLLRLQPESVRKIQYRALKKL